MAYYIQRKDRNSLETVDEFGTLSEAREMLKEYCLSDAVGDYYISPRACRAWRDNKKIFGAHDETG